MRIVACLLLLVFGADAAAQFPVDYDVNDNNLIDVRTVAQLRAITHDLDGNGSNAGAYRAAFPNAISGMGCPGTCAGYELLNDIDLADAAWRPLGYRQTRAGNEPAADMRYETTFEGNGHVIRRLYVPKPDASGDSPFAGLFSAIGSNGIVRNLGLVDVNVDLTLDDMFVGALAGYNSGKVQAVYAVGGSVRGFFQTGGLVGDNKGEIIASYTSLTVHAISRPGGGLTGRVVSGGAIMASYALGPVRPQGRLAGGGNNYGGLVGEIQSGGQTTNSYSSRALSGLPSWVSAAPAGVPRSRRDLHAPTRASGIYAAWGGLNVAGVAANPWDFGTPFEYPALRGVSPRFPQGNVAAIREQRQRHPGLGPAKSVFLLGPSGAVEEGSAAEYAVELDGTNTGTVTVGWVVESAGTGAGRAVSADFEMTRGTVNLVSVRRAVFRVRIVADGMVEPVESFRVKLNSVSGDPLLSLSASSSVVNTIALSAGLASLSGPRGPVAEGSTATYMVELDGGNPRAVTMSWSVELTGVGTGHAVLADFEETTGTAIIPAGSRSGSFEVMTRADDAVREHAEMFRVRLSDLRGGPTGLRLPASPSVVSVIAPGGENYDADGDGLIDVTTLMQLNALRYDARGAGIVGAALADVPAYVEAFAFFDPNLTCADGCRGYELLNDLDFNTGDAATRSDDLYWNGGAGWEPVNYRGTFDGNGYVLSNLYIDNNASGGANHGLFGALVEGSVIRGVGLVDASVESDGFPTGALAGFTAGGTTITSSYAAGGSVKAAWGTGGLVGFHQGVMVACYAAVTVTGTSVGSLVGSIGGQGGRVIASYGVGRVHTTIPNLEQTYRYGGLAGSRDGGCRSCLAFYSYYDSESTGLSHSNEGTPKTTGNLQTPVSYDDVAGNAGQAIYTTWNVVVSGDGTADGPWDFGTRLDYPVLRGAVTANVARQFALQPPITLRAALTGAATAFEGRVAEYTVRAPVMLHHAATAYWSVIATSATGMAAVEDFGDSAGMRLTRFPTGTAVIAAGSSATTFSVYPFDDQDAEPAERFSVRVDRIEDAGGRVIWSTGNSAVVASAIELSDGTDYDVDGDLLIDVATTSQLSAIRYDLGGVGLTGVSDTNRNDYLAAFALFDAAKTCPTTCTGYELSNDLDLSSVNPHPGPGWTPLGGGVGTLAADDYYTAVFEGNGYVISNLRVVRSGRLSHTGLFGAVGANGTVRNVGLRNVHISVVDHSTYIGALAGRNEGTVAASYVQGTTVSGVWAVGGLIGGNFGSGKLVASYADVRVHAGDGVEGANAGGLVGEAGAASVVSASYSIGPTTGLGAVGGLIGNRVVGAAVQSSYFDGERSAPSGCCGTNMLNPDDTSKTSAALSTPTAPAGIYAGWDRLNVNDVDENNDGDYNDDAPWDFGTFIDYPVLRGADGAVARRQFLLQDQLTLAVTLMGPATVFEGDTAEYTMQAPYALPYAATVHWSVSTAAGTSVVEAEDFGDGAGARLTRFPAGTAVIAAGSSATSFSVSIFDDGDTELAERFSVRVERVEDAGGGRIVWSTGNSSVVAVAIELSDGTNHDLDGDGLIDVATTSQLSAIRYDLGGRGLAGVRGDANRAAYLAAFDVFDPAQTCSGTCTGYELLNDLDLSSAGNWTPIGNGWGGSLHSNYYPISYKATFEGNGHVISNLRIDVSHWYIGLFSALGGSNGVIRNVGLVDVNVSGGTNVAALVGWNAGGTVATSYVVGGDVRARTPTVAGAGGLVGENLGTIIASYANVRVGSAATSGGLFYFNAGMVIASYSYGERAGCSLCGGLVGLQTQNHQGIESSYFDGDRGGWGNGFRVPGWTRQNGKTLRSPTTASGIYAGWDRLNVDNTSGTVMGVVTLNDDAPWDFGNTLQYPVLRHGRSAASVRAQQSSQTLLLRPTLRGDAVVSEGGTARYVVSLEQALPPSGLPSGVAASWSWSAGGAAVGGGDFDGTTGGRVVIAPGAVSASFSLAVATDGVAELDEAFEMSLGDGALSGAVGDASLGAGSAVRTTIAANELGQVTVAAESETVAEGATATFTLRLEGGDGGEVAVNFQIVAASESVTPADLGQMVWVDREGAESTQVSTFTGSASTGTVVLRMADPATVTVSVAADDVAGESGERFGVRLTHCHNCGSTRPVELGFPSSALVTIDRTPLTVSAQVYLEGAYISATSGMKTTLAGLLPRRQPYGAAPWNHLADTSVPPAVGLSGLSGVTSTAVDWVLVELRASTPGAGASAALPTTGGFAAGLLLSDGRIAGIGEGALLLDGVPVAAGFAQGSDIYVAIHHRNHLAVMSAQPATTGSGGCGVHYCADFRNVPSYQGCAQSRRAGGVYMMAAGDVNRSGIVSWGDDDLLLRENYAVDADLDFDGRLSPADVRMILANHLLASECTP